MEATGSFRVIIIVTLFLVGWAGNLAAEEENVTIRRIKVIINETLYTWEEGEPPIGEDDPRMSLPSTVLSFIALRPGQKLSEKRLKREIKRAVRRLGDSRYYYSVSATLLPAGDDPGVRTILVQVREGFRYRFGGGNAYAMFGMNNLHGRKKSFRVYAGANRLGGRFEDSRIAGSPFIWGASLFYMNDIGKVTPALYHLVTPGIYSGAEPHPDIRITLGADFPLAFLTEEDNYPGYEGGKRYDMLLSPKICMKRSFIGDTVLFETGFLAAPETLINLEGDAAVFMPRVGAVGAFHFARFNSLNLKVSSGWAGDDLPFLNAFNLYDTDDRSIRSGYSYYELNGESFFLINFEYRFTFSRIFIPPFFDTGIQLFIFSDIGWVEDHGRGMFSGDMKDAYGGGLRLLFENPVFAYFSFAYGVNRQGKGRFVFTGTAGF